MTVLIAISLKKLHLSIICESSSVTNKSWDVINLSLSSWHKWQCNLLCCLGEKCMGKCSLLKKKEPQDSSHTTFRRTYQLIKCWESSECKYSTLRWNSQIKLINFANMSCTRFSQWIFNWSVFLLFNLVVSARDMSPRENEMSVSVQKIVPI